MMTEEANEQHYGNDPAFFVAHLGPNLKYSACEWPSASNANGPNAPLGSGCTLAEAEAATLLIYQEKAGLSSLPKGSTVLDVSPKSGRAPLFATRAKYRADSAPIREVARFVAARPILLGVPQR